MSITRSFRARSAKRLAVRPESARLMRVGVLFFLFFCAPDIASGAEKAHANATSPAEVDVERTIEIERRKSETDRRGEAREERNYVSARRRILALEKALDMIVGSLVPQEHTLDPAKITQYRRGVDVARALLGNKPTGN